MTDDPSWWCPTDNAYRDELSDRADELADRDRLLDQERLDNAEGRAEQAEQDQRAMLTAEAG